MMHIIITQLNVKECSIILVEKDPYKKRVSHNPTYVTLKNKENYSKVTEHIK